MKGLLQVTFTRAPYKDHEGVRIYPYIGEDQEGYSWKAYSKDEVSVGDTTIVSLRSYKGKYYAKHIEKTETSSKKSK